MKSIPLTRGQFALVSDEDYDRVAPYKWFAHPAQRKRGGYYAKGRVGGKTVYMHRFLLGAKKGEVVDHQDGNGLNNCKPNIRIACKSTNNANRASSRSKTGLRGVNFNSKKMSPYRAEITGKVTRWRGPRRRCPIQAAIDYDRAAVRLWGEFARPNFPCIVFQKVL